MDETISWYRRHDCVFLKDILDKLRQHYIELEGNPNKKLIIYLLSCRGTTLKSYFPPDKEDLFYDTVLKQHYIMVDGQHNVELLRPVPPAGRHTRRSGKITTGMSDSERFDALQHEKNVKEAIKRAKRRAKKLKGGKSRKKRKTNKRRTNKRRTNKRKTNKRKTNKRKTNKRKTNKRKTNKRK